MEFIVNAPPFKIKDLERNPDNSVEVSVDNSVYTMKGIVQPVA